MTPRHSNPSPRNTFHQDLPINPTPRSQSIVESIYSQSQFSESSDSTAASSVDDAHPRLLRSGVYVPTVTFFHDDTEDLDLSTITKHAVRLAQAGVAGLTTQGSNGEAVHLTHQERKLVTKASRNALDNAGYQSLPIIVGCGSQSTRETIELCREAMTSGGDYALVLPPSYYKAMYKPESLVEFFKEVAEASPIPILIYNYPGAVAGIDIDSDVITKLAEHPNIVGCKLTCGNTGKLGRIASTVHAVTPSESGSGFMCMGGSADFTLQTLVVGGSGIIGGLGNIAPRACVRIIELYKTGKMDEAKKLQAIVARGDWAAISGGIVGTKSALETYYGYGGFARKPLPRPTEQEAIKYAAGFKELVELEKSLS
ncbi:MAG: hypothetical protein L6R41_005964 [Letrouitia leprolyta]|nr:MAG: hypothetical protein L6R41_005964 [Letrouitia leprolyta]